MEPAVARPNQECTFHHCLYVQRDEPTVTLTFILADSDEQRTIQVIPINGGLKFGKTNFEAAKKWRIHFHTLNTHENLFLPFDRIVKMTTNPQV